MWGMWGIWSKAFHYNGAQVDCLSSAVIALKTAATISSIDLAAELEHAARHFIARAFALLHKTHWNGCVRQAGDHRPGLLPAASAVCRLRATLLTHIHHPPLTCWAGCILTAVYLIWLG